MLDFDVRIATPIPFLERFERILDLRASYQNERQVQIKLLARRFCTFSLKDHAFLEHKPSVIAAACLLIAINLSEPPTAHAIDIKQTGTPMALIKTERAIPLSKQGLTDPSEASESSSQTSLELLWDLARTQVTGISVKDILPCYLTLLNSLDRAEFGGKLAKDP